MGQRTWRIRDPISVLCNLRSGESKLSKCIIELAVQGCLWRARARVPPRRSSFAWLFLSLPPSLSLSLPSGSWVFYEQFADLPLLSRCYSTLLEFLHILKAVHYIPAVSLCLSAIFSLSPTFVSSSARWFGSSHYFLFVLFILSFSQLLCTLCFYIFHCVIYIFFFSPSCLCSSFLFFIPNGFSPQNHVNTEEFKKVVDFSPTKTITYQTWPHPTTESRPK